MLLLISAIESPDDRELMTDFYNKNMSLLLDEAKKRLSTDEDSEDIVSEAIKKIIEKMDVFRSLAPMQQIRYALVTVRNLSYIHIKRQSQLPTVSFEDLPYEVADDLKKTPHVMAEEKAKCDQLLSIMSKLDQDSRMLLEQKYILRWTDVELAEKLNIKTESVRMKLTRAKRDLFAQIQEQGFQWTEFQ